MNDMKEYSVFLISTSNNILSERLDNGDEIKGTLCIDFSCGGFIFAFDDRIAFKFTDFKTEGSGFLSFTDGISYYTFSTKRPETIATVI